MKGLAIILHFILFIPRFSSNNYINSSNEQDLHLLLSRVVGVYKDPPQDPVITAKLNKTVLVTACNHGYLNHLFNFDCFMKRLNFKYLVMAFDKKAYQHLVQHTTIPAYFLHGGQEMSSEAEDFRSEKYNLLVMRKVEAVLTLLKLGYDVLFSDTDVAVLRDPIPYLLWDNVDYVHSFNDFCAENRRWDFLAEHNELVEGNTGFYFVKSNERTIKLFHEVILAAPSYPEFDDQRIFWKTILKIVNPPLRHIKQCHHHRPPRLYSAKSLVACMLDSCLFSAGSLTSRKEFDTVLRELKKVNETMITVHANWMIGNQNKANHLKQYGFWLLNEADHQCRPYSPKYV